MDFGVNSLILAKKHVELIGVEAGGPKNSKLHAAPLSRNAKIGVWYGAASYVCQNVEGQQIRLVNQCGFGLSRS